MKLLIENFKRFLNERKLEDAVKEVEAEIEGLKNELTAGGSHPILPRTPETTPKLDRLKRLEGYLEKLKGKISAIEQGEVLGDDRNPLQKWANNQGISIEQKLGKGMYGSVYAMKKVSDKAPVNLPPQFAMKVVKGYGGEDSSSVRQKEVNHYGWSMRNRPKLPENIGRHLPIVYSAEVLEIEGQEYAVIMMEKMKKDVHAISKSLFLAGMGAGEEGDPEALAATGKFRKLLEDPERVEKIAKQALEYAEDEIGAMRPSTMGRGGGEGSPFEGIKDEVAREVSEKFADAAALKDVEPTWKDIQSKRFPGLNEKLKKAGPEVGKLVNLLISKVEEKYMGGDSEKYWNDSKIEKWTKVWNRWMDKVNPRDLSQEQASKFARQDYLRWVNDKDPRQTGVDWKGDLLFMVWNSLSKPILYKGLEAGANTQYEYRKEKEALEKFPELKSFVNAINELEKLGFRQDDPDMKAANVMVSERGALVVADLGNFKIEKGSEEKIQEQKTQSWVFRLKRFKTFLKD